MTVNDKIKQILIDKNLTPSYFADEIGVQRSSISHILSGRNRPSFDIIQKIIRRFPDLGYDWIMEEDNSTVPIPHANRAAYRSTNADRFSSNQPSSSTIPQNSTGIRSQRTEIPPVLSPSSQTTDPITPPVVMPGTDRKVERILIFYTDGSFREYTPSL